MWRHTRWGGSQKCDHLWQGRGRGQKIMKFVWRNLWIAPNLDFSEFLSIFTWILQSSVRILKTQNPFSQLAIHLQIPVTVSIAYHITSIQNHLWRNRKVAKAGVAGAVTNTEFVSQWKSGRDSFLFNRVIQIKSIQVPFPWLRHRYWAMETTATYI